jgi:DNA-binding winged helix-turn-helix (wHTH) protein
MGMVKFGTFQVDIEELRIYTIEGELAVEPKVIDVLCYLIKNSERFVSLQELHAEIWSGRVVTDTAVRRTISKLRAVLGDTDPDAPLYIKSQMKRGYQFIYVSEPAQTSDSPAMVAENAMIGNTLQPSTKKMKATSPSLSRFWYAIFATLLISLSAVFTFKWINTTNEQEEIKTSPLVNIAGEKLLLSVSSDGRFHAFTGRLSKTDGWQPYLYDLKLGRLQKIDTPNGAAYHFVSVVNNDVVAISSLENGQAKLYLYAVADLKTPVRTILLNEFSDIGQAVTYQDRLVLINGIKKGEKNGLYYLLDLDNETVKQFTFSSRNGSVDLSIVLSPDKKHFALVRRDSGHQVQIYRTQNKELLAEELLDRTKATSDELNLVWRDNERLILNYSDKFKLLNIVSGERVMLPVTERFTGLGRDATGHFFGLLKRPQKKDFYQIQLPNLDSIERYFSFDKHAISLNYSQTPGKLWLLEQYKANVQLHHFNPDTGEKKLYLTTNELFSVVAESKNATFLLLLFNNNQLKQLDQMTGELKSISDVNQQVWSASFAEDDNTVFFSEKIGDAWQINAFDRKTMSQSLVLKGYRMLLPWRDHFIVADAKGTFYLLDQDYQLVKQLRLEVNFNLLHQVSLRGNTLITANIGSDSNWALSTLDLVTEQYERRLSKQLPIKSTFSFNNDGREALVFVENEYDNQLVRVGYNFGYN